MRGGPFHLIENAEHMSDGQGSEPHGQRAAARAGELSRCQQAIQRPILAEEEDLVLAREVVVEVSGRQVGSDRNITHPCGGESPRPEDLSGGAQDLDTATVGAA